MCHACVRLQFVQKRLYTTFYKVVVCFIKHNSIPMCNLISKFKKKLRSEKKHRCMTMVIKAIDYSVTERIFSV